MMQVGPTPTTAAATADVPPYGKALEVPTRSYTESTGFERAVGFLAASIFSCVYVAAPLWVMTALISIFYAGPMSALTALLWAPLIASMCIPDTSKGIGPYVLTSWLLRQIPKYFHYEEYHEITDGEMLSSGKSYVVGAHPHGVFSFCGVCAAVASTNDASGGFGTALAEKVPTAAASVLKVFPILKDVLGIFGVIPADGRTLTKRLARGSFCLYVGGMAELFRSSNQKEAVFLKQRKGFIKLALRQGADVIPVYLFGNTTVLSALTAGPLAALSRKLGVSVTLFWGRFGLPLPKCVRITYARGRPLGLPHIAEPTNEEVDLWHARYCEQLVQLFDRYKTTNPDYAHKQLFVE